MFSSPSSRLAAIGRAFFAAAIVFFGVQHLLYGEFVTRLLPPWPAWVPARAWWAYAIGVALLFAGVALLLPKFARRTALALGAVTFLSALLLALPPAARNLSVGLEWTKAGKALVFGGGAWLLAAMVPGEFARPGDAKLAAVGRGCFSGFMILCGIQHFLWARFVVALVPQWIPGAMAWTYFAGVALIAGGVGLLVPRTARLAAALSALMIFTWVIVLHLPRALANLHDANEATAVFEALAFSGLALLLALPRSAREPSPTASIRPDGLAYSDASTPPST
ncbi:DoxX protein [Opitutus terrae]|uniref:DoxX n=1 Tax=Opitutus terrae (strain DSM 11246 / JCM 15787 / PB90-1) TaxID=452637 RepID=B1ZR67_OPITP|nr:DoxX protein [Opitutus terrae]ACB74557.1 DoxX [Opitutus terrae PB90-1]